MKLKTIIRSNFSLMLYFILTYVDKALYFILPMVVLYMTKDTLAYNKVEYICSLTNIIVPFLTFVCSYSFYGYKESKNKNEFVKNYLSYSNVTTILVSLFVILVTGLLSFAGVKSLNGLCIFITIRTTFYIFIQYINCYYRLIDKPIFSLAYSIAINILSLLTVLIVSVIKSRYVLFAFFIPEIIALIIAIYLLLIQKKLIKWNPYLDFIKRSIIYSWPVVVNCTVVAFVANYGKVYAFNFLSDYEMYQLSFLLRIGMIVEMAHASIVSYYSKDVYLNGYTKRFILTYSVVMAITLSGVVGIMAGYNYLFDKQAIPLDGSFVLVLLYSLLHMVGAVVELDYGRNNKNWYIFIVSTVSCCLYLFMIFIIGVKSILLLTWYMMLYMLIYLILLLIVRRKVICKS